MKEMVYKWRFPTILHIYYLIYFVRKNRGNPDVDDDLINRLIQF